MRQNKLNSNKEQQV